MTDRSQEGLLINLWDEDRYSGHSSSCSPVHSDQGRGLTPWGDQGATPATAHRFQNRAVWGRTHRKQRQYIHVRNSQQHKAPRWPRLATAVSESVFLGDKATSSLRGHTLD